MLVLSVLFSSSFALANFAPKSGLNSAPTETADDKELKAPTDLRGETITISEPFKPDLWAKGVHLLAGFGVNTSVYNDVKTRRDFGLGSNFKADLGYYWDSRFAFELGSDVKFNWVDELLVWNTLFTVGLKYRFEGLLNKKESNFVRVFAGSAPTVVFLNGTQPAIEKTGATRVQFNGPVVGMAAGRFLQTDGGLNWFYELAFSYQWLREQEVIKDANDVPIVVSSGQVDNNSKIFSAFFNLGLLIF